MFQEQMCSLNMSGNSKILQIRIWGLRDYNSRERPVSRIGAGRARVTGWRVLRRASMVGGCDGSRRVGG